MLAKIRWIKLADKIPGLSVRFRDYGSIEFERFRALNKLEE